MFFLDLINNDIERIMSLNIDEYGEQRKPKLLRNINKKKGTIKMNIKELYDNNQIISSTVKINNNNIISSEENKYDSSKDFQKFNLKKVIKKISSDKVYEESIRKIIPSNEGLRTKDIKIDFDQHLKKESNSLNLSLFEIIILFLV